MRETYIRYGVDSDLATKLESLKISKTTFEKTPKQNLIKNYGLNKNEIDFVKDCIERKPIDSDTIKRLLHNSNYICCVCKGDKGKSYIIHHIEEYSVSQDNNYHNLAVLCPHDHDQAHKKGKSLTMKLNPEDIIEAKHFWEKEVKDLNIERASRSGNIFETDFLNIPRIVELYVELFKTLPNSKYSIQLENLNLLDENGELNKNNIQQFNSNPETPLIFFGPDGSSLLQLHYFEVFKKILNHLNFQDLDSLLKKEEIKKGLIGKYCYYVGGLYSSRLPNPITEEVEMMKFYFKKKKFIVEWLVDPKYFCSSSAKWRTFERTTYMIYGKVRNVHFENNDNKKSIRIDLRPYCFGLPELTKDRKPLVAYEKEFESYFDEEE